MTLPGALAALLMLSGAAALGAGPAPTGTPTPVASPRQLREIGRVHVSVCANIVVHANSAIASSLRNDATLAQTATRLRATDLDSADPLAYQNAVTDFDRLAGQLYDNSVRGLGEVQRLRDLTNASKDPTRKAELEKFTDALGGALNRQKQSAVDLIGYVRYLQARDLRKEPDVDRAVAVEGFTPAPQRADGSVSAMMAPSPFALWNDGHGTLRGMSQNAAADFEQRSKQIAQDESTAEEHAEGAVSGC